MEHAINPVRPSIAKALLASCLIVLAAATGAQAGILDAVTGEQRPTTRWITHDGRLRSYQVLVPTDVSSTAAIVVGLHGGAVGNAGQFAKSSGLSAAALDHGFVVIYPQGVLNTWNAGDCCGAAYNQAVDDVGFIRAAIEQVRTGDGITGPAYATGISNGGMMSYWLACEAPDVFAAVAPVAASLELDALTDCTGGPVALLHIHGMQDQYVPYDGGTPTKGFGQFTDVRVSVPASITRRSVLNGCSEHPGLDRPNRMTAKIVETQSTGCAEPVVLVTIRGAGHTWPGSDQIGATIVDPNYPGYAATDRILRFFGL